MNVALSELPDFTACPDGGRGASRLRASSSRPSLDYMDRAYLDARSFGWSRAPIVEMLIPSTLDDRLAPRRAARGEPVLPARRAEPAGRCVMGRPSRDRRRSHDRDGRSLRAEFPASVLGRQILSPLDLESDVRAASAAISFMARSSWSRSSRRGRCWATRDYRGPIAGLYMCGAGAHPGGGVTGAPGHNAAREILRDFRRKRGAWLR